MKRFLTMCIVLAMFMFIGTIGHAREVEAVNGGAILSAPGKGMIPGISDHSAAMPLLYVLAQQPIEHMTPLLSRQYLHGAQSTFVKWTAKKGAVVPLHHHMNEQMTWIISGRAEVFSNGKKYIAKAGDILVFPPNVPHEFHFLEDTIDIDFFSPGRQDWIDGTDQYLKQGK